MPFPTLTAVLLQYPHRTPFISHRFVLNSNQPQDKAAAEAWLQFITLTGPIGSLGYESVAALPRD